MRRCPYCDTRFDFDSERHICPNAPMEPEAMTKMRKALRECREVLELCQTKPTYPKDAPETNAVKAVCEFYGYGAVMHCASSLWMERLAEQGYPAGAAHTAGPCASTVEATLKLINEAIIG